MGCIDMPRAVVVVRTVVAAAIVSFMTGCTLGANYARPPIANPSQYRFVAPAAQAQSLADVPWFQVFDDPSLQALVREALANNLDLQIAVARVEEARARAGIATSFLYPQVDAVGSYGVRQASNTGQDDTSDDADTTHQSGTLGFRLSWEIDLFGRLRRGREAALALALASEQGRRGVLVTLIGDVATNYFLLRELDRQLEIARGTLRINDETVTYFQNRLTGGVSNRLELDRIQANRALTAVAIPQIEQQIAVVENALSLLLGRPPDAVTRRAAGRWGGAAAGYSSRTPCVAHRAAS